MANGGCAFQKTRANRCSRKGVRQELFLWVSGTGRLKWKGLEISAFWKPEVEQDRYWRAMERQDFRKPETEFLDSNEDLHRY